MMLQGHSEEVTSVVWCPTDFTKVKSQGQLVIPVLFPLGEACTETQMLC